MYNNFMYLSKTQSYERGFVLLYAVLVAGVVLIGGVLLSSIISKQLILSTIGRESQFAYYAANAGDECAKYAESQLAFGYFDVDENGQPIYVPPSSDPEITCNESDIYVDVANQGSNRTFVFEVKGLDRGSCSVVEVVKGIEDGQKTVTTIISRGYNLQESGQACGQSSSPRLLEKVIIRS